MKVLMLWNQIPSPYTGTGIPAFNLLRQLRTQHEFTLIAFQNNIKEMNCFRDIQQICHKVETAPLEEPQTLMKLLFYTTKNTFSLQNILSNNRTLFNYYYSPLMHNKIREMLISQEFDVIYTDLPMAFYIQKLRVPKVVHELDCATEMYRQRFTRRQNIWSKLFQGLQYLKVRSFEKNVLRRFNTCVIVNKRDGESLKRLCPDLNMILIPNGVDTEYFIPRGGQEKPATLTFIGDMSYPPNVDAIQYFYRDIYGKLKSKLNEINLYIVGRNPTREIRALSCDSTVTVTGYVEDVRPYISSASVIIAPFISGTGIKNKILEAMASGKPVISTSIGVDGIEAVSGKDVIIADEAEVFINSVINLLSDSNLRKIIGENGRRFVEANYSWAEMAKRLDQTFHKVVNGYNEQTIKHQN